VTWVEFACTAAVAFAYGATAGVLAVVPTLRKLRRKPAVAPSVTADGIAVTWALSSDPDEVTPYVSLAISYLGGHAAMWLHIPTKEKLQQLLDGFENRPTRGSIEIVDPGEPFGVRATMEASVHELALRRLEGRDR
jgi:hypothetical protein